MVLIINELELLEQLQTIKHKLDNNIELTDDEYKLFAYVLFAVAMGIIQESLDFMLNVMEGDKNE